MLTKPDIAAHGNNTLPTNRKSFTISNRPPQTLDCDVAVVGTGPAGLLSACIFDALGLTTALLGPRPNTERTERNARTAALFPGSLSLLQQLGLWSDMRDACAEMKAIRIVDDMNDTLLRAPEVVFTATEVQAENFGYNVPNDVLVRALWQAFGDASTHKPSSALFVETAAVTDVRPDDDHVTLTCEDGVQCKAKLVVGADGRKSICRQAAKITTKNWSYPQVAVTCVFDHVEPHNGISTEFHRQSGPCTTVPMPGNTSSLVWLETPDNAKQLAELKDDEFADALSTRLKGHLGALSNVSPRTIFPMSGLEAQTSAAHRIALVGETAHVMPPIGAQGLNLSFRDIAALATVIQRQRRGDMIDFDPGAPSILRAYAKARKTDVQARVWGVDLLNRSLLAGPGVAHLLRGAGLHILKAFPALRRQIITRGLHTDHVISDLQLLKSANQS